MKLVHLHGVRIHKGCEVIHGGAKKWAPLCQPRVWQSAGLFKGGIQVIDPFEGEESQIDCERCLAKMGRREKCPKNDPSASATEAQLRACRRRLLTVERSIDALQRERESLRSQDRQLAAELNVLDVKVPGPKRKKK